MTYCWQFSVRLDQLPLRQYICPSSQQLCRPRPAALLRRGGDIYFVAFWRIGSPQRYNLRLQCNVCFLLGCIKWRSTASPRGWDVGIRVPRDQNGTPRSLSGKIAAFLLMRSSCFAFWLLNTYRLLQICMVENLKAAFCTVESSLKIVFRCVLQCMSILAVLSRPLDLLFQGRSQTGGRALAAGSARPSGSSQWRGCSASPQASSSSWSSASCAPGERAPSASAGRRGADPGPPTSGGFALPVARRTKRVIRGRCTARPRFL